jgi:methyl-accepting chemotaxis protein
MDELQAARVDPARSEYQTRIAAAQGGTDVAQSAHNAAQALIDEQITLASASYEAVNRSKDRIDMVAAGGTLLALALGSLLALFITRSITQPMQQALQVAQAVAQGNLTAAVDSDARDETGQLLRALKTMNQSLARIVLEVRTAADAIASGSNQIASANAAKEIKALIGSSVERVQAGTEQVGQAGQSVADIVAQVQRVTDLIAEISAASREQSEGITQVGEAVQQLDHVTQQNAALVEQRAAAADSLRGQAAHLKELVVVFKLDAANRA